MAEQEDHIFVGGIWSTPGVSEQPSLTLIRWRVFEVTEGAHQGNRHIVGYCLENHEGRASTAIVSFDPATGRCVTRSGRVYQLSGPACFDGDGDYVWRWWSQANGFQPERDVSSEYEVASSFGISEPVVKDELKPPTPLQIGKLLCDDW